MSDSKKNQQDHISSMDRLGELLGQLNSINQMMDDFLAGEGMIICENCLDNVFDDDEDIVTLTDDEGKMHQFCCRKCLEEWKLKNNGGI